MNLKFSPRSYANTFYTIVGFFILTTTNVMSDNSNIIGESSKILTAQFKERQVVQIESGDFYFKPRQLGPIHTHPAPCVGYIVKGAIIYQVEGEKPQMLRTGDAFFEPSGPRILRFDNASATTETNFIDFCPEQQGEPFLVFEQKPTEFIDRRALVTATFDSAKTFNQVEVFEHLFPVAAKIQLDTDESQVAGYVVMGKIKVKTEGQETKVIKSGENFYLSASHYKTLLINASSKNKAKIITFKFH